MDLYIVTGASRGIGWSLVRQIARLDAASALAISRSGMPEKLTKVYDLRCDLGVQEGQRTAMSAVKRSLTENKWQRAVLVNNAGMVEPVAPIERCDLETLTRNINVNLVAPIALMQAFLEASGSVAKRAIINISSGASRNPVFGYTGYCSTKAGLDMASQVVAFETAQKGTPLRVTSLAPGMVDTAMQGVLREMSEADFPIVEHFRAMKAQGALQNPDTVAAKILRLHLEDRLPDGVATLADL
jgi:benzil reductase ((S)-benzoin forming)